MPMDLNTHHRPQRPNGRRKTTVAERRCEGRMVGRSRWLYNLFLAFVLALVLSAAAVVVPPYDGRGLWSFASADDGSSSANAATATTTATTVISRYHLLELVQIVLSGGKKVSSSSSISSSSPSSSIQLMAGQHANAVPLPFGLGAPPTSADSNEMAELLARVSSNAPTTRVAIGGGGGASSTDAKAPNNNNGDAAPCTNSTDDASCSYPSISDAPLPESQTSRDLVYIPPVFLQRFSTSSSSSSSIHRSFTMPLVAGYVHTPSRQDVIDLTAMVTDMNSSDKNVSNVTTMLWSFLKVHGSSGALSKAVVEALSPTQVALLTSNRDLDRIKSLVFGGNGFSSSKAPSNTSSLAGSPSSFLESRPTRDCRSILVSLSLFDDDDAEAFKASFRGSMHGTDGTANSFWWRRVMGVSAVMWFRLLSPFAIYPTFAGVLLGNMIVTIGLLIISVLVVGLYKLARPKRSWLDCCCICRFPSTTIGLIYNVMCGTAISAAAIISSLWHDLADDIVNLEANGIYGSPLVDNKSVAEMGAEEHTGSIVLAFLTAIFILFAPFTIYYLCRHYLAPIRFVKIKAPTTRIAGFILPSGQIQPYPARTAFVNIVGDVMRQSIVWSMLPTLLPLWLFITYLAASTYCAVFVLLAMFGVCVQLVAIAHFKPYFSRARNFFESVVLLITAICLFFVSISLWSVENMHDLSARESERLMSYLEEQEALHDDSREGGGDDGGQFTKVDGFFQTYPDAYTPLLNSSVVINNTGAGGWDNAVLFAKSNGNATTSATAMHAAADSAFSYYSEEAVSLVRAEALHALLVMLLEPTHFAMQSVFNPIVIILTLLVCIRIPNVLITFMALDDPWRSKWDQPGSDEFGLSNTLWTRLAPSIATALFMHLKKKRKHPVKSYRRGKIGKRRREALEERSRLLGAADDGNSSRVVGGRGGAAVTSSASAGSYAVEMTAVASTAGPPPTATAHRHRPPLREGAAENFDDDNDNDAAEMSEYSVPEANASGLITPPPPSNDNRDDGGGANALDVTAQNISHLSPIAPRRAGGEYLPQTAAGGASGPLIDDSIAPFFRGREGGATTGAAVDDTTFVVVGDNTFLGGGSGESNLTPSSSQQPAPHQGTAVKGKRMALGAAAAFGAKQTQQQQQQHASVSPRANAAIDATSAIDNINSNRKSSSKPNASFDGSDIVSDNNSAGGGGGESSDEGEDLLAPQSKGQQKDAARKQKKLAKEQEKALAKQNKQLMKEIHQSHKADGVLFTLRSGGAGGTNSPLTAGAGGGGGGSPLVGSGSLVVNRIRGASMRFNNSPSPLATLTSIGGSGGDNPSTAAGGSVGGPSPQSPPAATSASAAPPSPNSNGANRAIINDTPPPPPLPAFTIPNPKPSTSATSPSSSSPAAAANGPPQASAAAATVAPPAINDSTDAAVSIEGGLSEPTFPSLPSVAVAASASPSLLPPLDPTRLMAEDSAANAPLRGAALTITTFAAAPAAAGPLAQPRRILNITDSDDSDDDFLNTEKPHKEGRKNGEPKAVSNTNTTLTANATVAAVGGTLQFAAIPRPKIGRGNVVLLTDSDEEDVYDLL